MHRRPEPDPESLLPPLLSCLPTAFLSTRPPPPLLPLLSPILRQRIHLLSSSAAQNQQDQLPSERSSTWLPYLTYTTPRAEEVQRIVSGLLLEPHPVSGQLELFTNAEEEEAGKVHYRRLDQETLQARCDVILYHLGVVWVWCENDTGGTGLEAVSSVFGAPSGDAPVSAEPSSGWRVAEILPLDETETQSERSIRRRTEGWKATQAEADEAFAESNKTFVPGFPFSRGSSASNQHRAELARADKQGNASDNDSDDYWAMYDRTPGRGTPDRKSPVPTTGRTGRHPFSAGLGQGLTPVSSPEQRQQLQRPQVLTTEGRSESNQSAMSQAEAAYYAQYDSVEPAVDAREDQPSEPEPPRGRAAGRPDLRLESMSRNGEVANGRDASMDQAERDYYAQYDTIQPEIDEGAAEGADGEEAKTACIENQGQSPGNRYRSPTPPPNTAFLRTSEIEPPLGMSPANALSDALRQSGESGQRGTDDDLERKPSISAAVETSVAQHVSGEIKSLFRLSQRVGMSRDEFDRLVRRELEVLGMMDLEVA